MCVQPGELFSPAIWVLIYRSLRGGGPPKGYQLSAWTSWTSWLHVVHLVYRGQAGQAGYTSSTLSTGSGEHLFRVPLYTRFSQLSCSSLGLNREVEGRLVLAGEECQGV